MDRRFLIAGAAFGFLGVIIGAFAAHGLRPLLDEASMASFETGVKYQMYHALLLVILGGVLVMRPKLKLLVFYLLLIGIIFFSGSIYLLATNHLTTINFKSIALATPLGGTLLITAWAILLVHFISLKNK